MAMKMWTEDKVRRAARILGPASAAARAVRDFETRREAGENVAFYMEGNTWIVGPDCSHLLPGDVH